MTVRLGKLDTPSSFPHWYKYGMKTFQSFQAILSEGRDAPLFHGTSVFHACRILRSGYIYADTPQTFKRDGKSIELMGVSLTRNKHFALHWAMSRFKKSNDYGAAIFEFDQARLAYNYKIVPFNYGTDVSKNTPARYPYNPKHQLGNESEEFLITKRGIPINPYVVSVQFPLSERLFMQTLEHEMDPNSVFQVLEHKHLFKFNSSFNA